jgi:hypothetical protein
MKKEDPCTADELRPEYERSGFGTLVRSIASGDVFEL